MDREVDRRVNGKRKTTGDRGMTLLEVLVAVFVLAIVVVPLLNVFANNAALLRTAYEKTDATYDAKAMMENLYPLGYSDLFKQGKSAPVPDGNGKYYTLQLSPGGPGGIMPGVTEYCYLHIIVNAGGSGVCAGPDGKLDASGSLPAISVSDLADLTLSAPVSGIGYALTNGSGATVASGDKPQDATLVLIVNTRLDSVKIGVQAAAGTTAAVLVYAPSTFPRKNLTPSDTPLYNNDDNALTTMLVTAVLKIYSTASPGSQEGVFQDVLKVGGLP